MFEGTVVWLVVALRKTKQAVQALKLSIDKLPNFSTGNLISHQHKPSGINEC